MAMVVVGVTLLITIFLNFEIYYFSIVFLFTYGGFFYGDEEIADGTPQT